MNGDCKNAGLPEEKRYITFTTNVPSLRDQFAMAALPYLLTKRKNFGEGDLFCAEHAYRIADAMMRERNKVEITNPSHLWSDEQVAKLKRQGIIAEDEPSTIGQTRGEKEKLAQLIVTPVSDPEKFKRCTDCGAEIPVDKYCEDCLPF